MNTDKTELITKKENYINNIMFERLKQIKRILDTYKNYKMNFILNNEYKYFDEKNLNFWIKLYELKYYSFINQILYNKYYLEQLKTE